VDLGEQQRHSRPRGPRRAGFRQQLLGLVGSEEQVVPVVSDLDPQLDGFYRVLNVVVDTNLKGAFNFIQAVERPMIKQRSGRIINIASVAGIMGNAGQANYAASKAGLLGLTKSIARELASRNITANAVAPGFIQTDMTDVLPEQVKTGVTGQIPMGTFGQPEDIASAVAFLASAEAKYITGQCLVVDGGMVM
jgi:3-oxoacyl-[acyl-carrier protein] reductase